MRNFIDHAIGQQAARLLGEKEDVSKIQNEELFLITRDDISMLEEEGKKEREAGTLALQKKNWMKWWDYLL